MEIGILLYPFPVLFVLELLQSETEILHVMYHIRYTCKFLTTVGHSSVSWRIRGLDWEVVNIGLLERARGCS